MFSSSWAALLCPKLKTINAIIPFCPNPHAAPEQHAPNEKALCFNRREQGKVLACRHSYSLRGREFS